MNHSVDPLDELLDRSSVAPEPPSHLVAKIRARIADQPARAQLSWMSRLDVVFARPSFAATFIAACVLLGLFLAEARLTRWHAARGAEMARSYVKLIDPLLPPAPSAASRSP